VKKTTLVLITFQGGKDMHSSSVWQEYFYIFRIFWRSVQAAFNALTKQTGNGYRRERGAYK
jgi:hypothetical protein